MTRMRVTPQAYEASLGSFKCGDVLNHRGEARAEAFALPRVSVQVTQGER